MTFKVAVLAGDGVGPEVMDAAIEVLEATGEALGRSFAFEPALIGGCAIDQTGTALPDATVKLCSSADAVLLGAVGGPKWDDPTAAVRPEQGLLGIRKALGLFANLRPVRVHPALADAGPLRQELVSGLDLLVVRELTGGLYFGERGRQPHPSGEQAFDTMIYATDEIERVVRLAARAAKTRHNRIASVDKANVLESSRLWRATAERVLREEFPALEREHVLVDAAAMHLIQRPHRFDVIVTENMFGDILTDEASVLAGSMGLLPSASLGDGGPGLYEPIHGSAPDIAGKGVANPIGMILSTAMMCRHSLDWPQAAELIEESVDQVISDGLRTTDLARKGEKPVGTQEAGALIAAAVRERAAVPTSEAVR
ncbi:MAG TPA: 3-isopropylmalate dehydrogenase [Phycisphaerae bacterium]|nr:3-isopropylmalate dehydrogenase [Phycisphaerae bacterium]